jgi:hypothetical protein
MAASFPSSVLHGKAMEETHEDSQSWVLGQLWVMEEREGRWPKKQREKG